MGDSETNEDDLPEPQLRKSKTENIIVIRDKSKQPLIANLIAAGAVLISGFLFYFTYQLYRETKKATTNSETSANAATNAVAEQKRMDSFSIISQQKSFSRDSFNQEMNLKIASNTLKLQVNSLNQAQTDFETENRPFLKFEPYDIQIKPESRHYTIRVNISPKSPKQDTIPPIKITLGGSDTIVLNSSFSNLGRFPAYKINISVMMGAGLDTNRLVRKTEKVSVKMLDYVSGNSKTDTIGFEYISHEPLDSLYKRKNLFFFIKIQYESPTLKNSYYHEYFVYGLKFDTDHYRYLNPILVKPN